MNSYRKGSFQLEITPASATSVTVTLEGTIQDDGTAPASCTYQDITNDVFGVANATADDMWLDNAEALAGLTYARIKVAVVYPGDEDDADWTIYHKKLY